MKRLKLKRYGAKLALELTTDLEPADNPNAVWFFEFVYECETEMTAQISEVYARKMLAKALKEEKP